MTRAKEMRDLPLAIDVDSSGKVMIGTTTEGSANYADNLTIADSAHGGITIRTGTSNQGAVYFSDSTSGAGEYIGYVIYDHSGNNLNLGTNANERMRIDSTGKVGIGTTNPIYPLQVSGSNVTSGGGQATLGIYDTGTAYNGTNPGGGVTFRGIFNSGGSTTNFGTVQGIKENATDGNYATALRFTTRANGGNLTEKMRIASDGKVGIGTTNPLVKLDMGVTSPNDQVIALRQNGISRTTLGITANYGVRVAGPGDASATGAVFEVGQNLASDGTTYQNTRFSVLYNGNVGVGAPSPYKKLTLMSSFGGSAEDVLDIQSSTSGGGTAPKIRFGTMSANSNTIGRIGFIDEPNYGGEFVVETNSSGSATDSTTEKFRVDKDGNVGIGTNNPLNQLHIHGGSATQYLRIENGGSGNMGGIYLKTSDNSDLAKFLRMQGYYTDLGAHNNEGIRFDFEGTKRYIFRGSAGGNNCFNASNSSNWNTTSDERIKTNIKTLEDGAIDKIKALRPVTFDYTDDWAEHRNWHKITNAPGETEAEHYNTTDHGIDQEKQKGQIGWIAQEYKTVFPKDVDIDEDTVGETKYDDFHTLNPESIVPTLVKALQEAVTKIDALETRIKALES